MKGMKRVPEDSCVLECFLNFLVHSHAVVIGRMVMMFFTDSDFPVCEREKSIFGFRSQ